MLPHHVAQKSMSTGVLLLRTCSSKSASLTLPTQTGFNTASLFGLPADWLGQGKEPRRARWHGDLLGQVHLNGDKLCIRFSQIARYLQRAGLESGQGQVHFLSTVQALLAQFGLCVHIIVVLTLDQGMNRNAW